MLKFWPGIPAGKFFYQGSPAGLFFSGMEAGGAVGRDVKKIEKNGSFDMEGNTVALPCERK